MFPANACRGILILAIAFLAPGLAAAQPIFETVDSLEFAVTDAWTVVVGTVEDLGAEPPESGLEREVTIAVAETLKGEPREAHRVVVSETKAALSRWHDERRRLLVAIPAQGAGSLRVIDLSDEALAVITMDFDVLTDADAVIDAARSEARRMPGVMRIRAYGLPVPREAAVGTKWARHVGVGGIILAVPVDDRLERIALELIQSESPGDRYHGICALRSFKSEANIDVAMSLLDDASQAFLHRAEDKRGLEVRSFWIRSAAYDTLRHWGVAVEQPVLTEERWRPELVGVVSFDDKLVSEGDLGELAQFENLHLLSMRRVKVADESLRQLGQLSKLQELYLSDTAVTDAGLAHIAAVASLRYVDLRGSTATAAGIARLREARPNLDVDF